MKKGIIFFAIGVIAGAVCYSVKDKHSKSNPIDIFNRRDINKQKYEEQGLDEEEDINLVTLDNNSLSVKDRATSKLIFDYYYEITMNSKNEETFQYNLDKMWDFYWVLYNDLELNTSETKKKVETYILYHKAIMNKSDGLDKIVNNAVDKIDLKKLIFKK